MAATTHAGTGPEGDPPRSWWERNAANIVLPGLTVLVTAVAGTFAALYAHGQISAADQQKIVAQQQELLTLVVDIEQEPAAEERATAPLHGTLLLNTQVQFQDELTSYAEAAQPIIGNLAKDSGVPSFEYVQVGKALAATGNNYTALTYFQRAATAHVATPDTRAAALRNEAGVRYSLGEAGLAHRENMRAVWVFAHYPDLTRSDAGNNTAQSYLADASSEISVGNCSIAQADQQAAARVLGTLPDRNRTEATVNRVLTSDDKISYRKHCLA